MKWLVNNKHWFTDKAWGFVILVALLSLGVNLLLLDKIIDQQRHLDHQADNIEQLVKEEKKLNERIVKLSEDNLFLNDRGLFYYKCGLKLFAEYTQTLAPIEFSKLTRCEYESANGVSQQNYSPSGNSTRNTIPGTSQQKPSGGSSSNNGNNNGNNRNTPPEPPTRSILPFVEEPVVGCVTKGLCI